MDTAPQPCHFMVSLFLRPTLCFQGGASGFPTVVRICCGVKREQCHAIPSALHCTSDVGRVFTALRFLKRHCSPPFFYTVGEIDFLMQVRCVPHYTLGGFRHPSRTRSLSLKTPSEWLPGATDSHLRMVAWHGELRPPHAAILTGSSGAR